MLDQLTVLVFIALGAVLIIWYLAGNELMRRRGRSLAVWCKRAADNLSSKQAIQWYTLHSFKIEVQEPKKPFRSVSLTGLTESWEVPVIWLWNRFHWRRDMVLAQLALDRQPVWGCELYRPRSVLAGDASYAARQEGWEEAPLDGFRVAPANGPGSELAHQLLAELGDQRHHLIRLSVRRRDTQLALALNVPDPQALAPVRFYELLRRLAAISGAKDAPV